MPEFHSDSCHDAKDWQSSEFLTLASAARVLALSKGSLYNLEKSGRLPFVRLAGRTLVRTSDVINLADSAEPWVPSTRADKARATQAESKRVSEREGQ